jgi:hypothetical protein
VAVCVYTGYGILDFAGFGVLKYIGSQIEHLEFLLNLSGDWNVLEAKHFQTNQVGQRDSGKITSS